MNKLNKILLVAVVALLAAIFALLYVQKGLSEKSYYAVYMRTGDIYFGELRGNRLSSVLFLQQSDDGETAGVGLSEFKNAFWGPEGVIILNPDQVVWKARLAKSSQIIGFIKSGISYGEQVPQSAIPAPSVEPGR